MTKQQFDHDFRFNDLEIIAQLYETDGVPDRPARREAYNNKVDHYQKDGLISEDDANEWCITDSLESTLYWL